MKLKRIIAVFLLVVLATSLSAQTFNADMLNKPVATDQPILIQMPGLFLHKWHDLSSNQEISSKEANQLLSQNPYSAPFQKKVMPARIASWTFLALSLASLAAGTAFLLMDDSPVSKTEAYAFMGLGASGFGVAALYEIYAEDLLDKALYNYNLSVNGQTMPQQE